MHIPPPQRRDHYPEEFQRPTRPKRREVEIYLSGTPRFVDRMSPVNQAEERAFNNSLGARLRLERNYAQSTIAQKELVRSSGSLSLEPITGSRRVIDEKRHANGAITRWYSDGSKLTKLPNGEVHGSLADGSEFRSSDSSEIRIGGACALKAEK